MGSRESTPEQAENAPEKVPRTGQRVTESKEPTSNDDPKKELGESSCGRIQNPTRSLEKAIELVQQATTEDRNRNYEEALKLYEESVACFIHVIKYGSPNESVKQKLRSKCTQYLERAERLKDHLAMTSKTSANKALDEEKKWRERLRGAVHFETPNTPWSDVIGMDKAKQLLNEIVFFPLKFPRLSKYDRTQTKSILLYGPSGTGKSHMAKALATEAKRFLLSVSSPHLTSKWQGESEKFVETLFQVARENEPAMIFLDQADSLFSSRSESESEVTRSIKREFLFQLSSKGFDVLVVAATDIPWALDPAVSSKFEKKICITLPEVESRQSLFKLHMGDTPTTLTDSDYKCLAEQTQGYSGADIGVVVKEALHRPIKKMQRATHFKRCRGPSVDDAEVMVDDFLTPCAPDEPGAIKMTWLDVQSDKMCEPKVCMRDMSSAILNVRPTVGEDYMRLLREFNASLANEGQRKE